METGQENPDSYIGGQCLSLQPLHLPVTQRGQRSGAELPALPSGSDTHSADAADTFCADAEAKAESHLSQPVLAPKQAGFVAMPLIPLCKQLPPGRTGGWGARGSLPERLGTAVAVGAGWERVSTQA